MLNKDHSSNSPHTGIFNSQAQGMRGWVGGYLSRFDLFKVKLQKKEKKETMHVKKTRSIFTDVITIRCHLINAIIIIIITHAAFKRAVFLPSACLAVCYTTPKLVWYGRCTVQRRLSSSGLQLLLSTDDLVPNLSLKAAVRLKQREDAISCKGRMKKIYLINKLIVGSCGSIPPTEER